MSKDSEYYTQIYRELKKLKIGNPVKFMNRYKSDIDQGLRDNTKARTVAVTMAFEYGGAWDRAGN